MTDTASRPRPATRANHCPVCDGDHKCSRKEDGFILCGRRTGEQPGFVYLGQATGDEQFAQYRAEGDPVLETRRDDRARALDNGHAKQTPKPPAIDWKARANQYANALTVERRDELARTLGMPVTAIDAFTYVGWHAHESAWTLPEFDASGTIVGLNRRYLDGSKKIMYGGSHGLYVAEFWDKGGSLFLPEGFSDTAALGSMGLSAIGRPSNMAGVEQLTEMLRGVPASRLIVVLAEYDPNPEGKWPGLEGAKLTAAKLSKALDRPVCWALPPDKAKDTRKWALERIAEGKAWDALGTAFVANIKVQGSKPEDAQKPLAYQFAPIDSATFAAADFRQEWLVKRCLVRGQVGVLGGGKKSLKTTVAIDLALSLATTERFLGEFEVYRPLRVCLISGESGEFTLQETARRIAVAKGIELAEANILWDFRLPQLSRPVDLMTLAAGLKTHEVDVLLFDPLYLALIAGGTDVDAANLFEVGPLLANFTRACLDAGVTPIILHHFRKTSQAGDELDLNALAFAGIAEFARQWLLIGRREAYAPGSGLHRLTMVVGGSAGQSGSWSVDVDEGQLAEDFTGRKWDVRIESTGETVKNQCGLKEQQRKEREDQKRRELDGAFLNAMDTLIANGQPVTKTKVRNFLAWSGDKVNGCIARLKLQDVIETYSVAVRSGNTTKTDAEGLRRCAENSTAGQRPDNGRTDQVCPPVGTAGLDGGP